MVSKNKKKNNKILIGVIFMVVLILLAIIFTLKKEPISNEEIVEEKLTQEQVQDLENKAIIAQLQKMEERDRMEYYFGIFLGHIEKGDYEKAYELLYPEFKEKYFPTIEEFTAYAQKTFPEMSNVEHENIERNGEIYVLWIYISDAVNGKPGEKTEMNFVIKENDYNDFVMSFSVK